MHTHTHTHQRHRRSRWHGFIKHGKFAKRHTNIIRRHTRLYIQTHFIRMDFVTAGKRLLHFHVPSDIIFRALHYFALIKCGRWKRSNGCFCSVWRPVHKTVTQTRLHEHTHTWKCFKMWLITNQTCCLRRMCLLLSGGMMNESSRWRIAR